MRVSIKWLKEFLPDLDQNSALDILPRLGLGVEEVVDVGQQGVLTARVDKISKHRKRGNLLVLKLISRRPYNVVTGAKNFKEGDIVLLAPPGAVIAGKQIEPEDFFSIRSEGMLVSETELGISERSTGIIVLDKHIKPGIGFNKIFDSTIIDLEVTPNRGDCESILGVARELSVGLKRKLNQFRLKLPRLKAGPRILVQDSLDCPRYTAMIIDDVEVRDSPFDVKWRLFHHGIRSINSLVDITNYVMLMLGQPLHAFDLALIKGRVRVRRAKDNERMTTLDGSKIKLSKEHLIIADQEGPIALAGVVGGKKAEIRRDTKKILLESATFCPETVRKATRGLLIDTQSGRRFERGTDPAMPPLAAQLAAQLIVGQPVAFTDVKVPLRRKRISCDHKRISRYLGLGLKRREVLSILNSLDFKPTGKGSKIQVSVPTYRRDISEECDIVEEVARIYGYDRIPSKISHSGLEGFFPKKMAVIRRLRLLLIGLGFYESHCFAPISQQVIELLGLGSCVRINNPLNERFTYLRPSLAPGLIDVLAANYRNGNLDVRIFEIGKVFVPARPRPKESNYLGIIVGGRKEPLHWSGHDQVWDFFDAKGILEFITRYLNTGEFSIEKDELGLFDENSNKISIGGRGGGCIGRLAKHVLAEFGIKGTFYFLEIDLDRLFERISQPIYIPYPKFPKVRRDLAFIVDESVPAEKLIRQIKSLGGPLLTDVTLFDFYKGKEFPKGKSSLGFRLTFQPEERTLTDGEIKNFIKKVVSGLKAKFGVNLRDKEVDFGGT